MKFLFVVYLLDGLLYYGYLCSILMDFASTKHKNELGICMMWFFLFLLVIFLILCVHVRVFGFAFSTHACLYLLSFLLVPGIEVKPGKTHPYHSDNVPGKLRITQVCLVLTPLCRWKLKNYQGGLIFLNSKFSCLWSGHASIAFILFHLNFLVSTFKSTGFWFEPMSFWDRPLPFCIVIWDFLIW